MAVNKDLRAQIFRDILLYWQFPEDLFEGSEERMAALHQSMNARGRHPVTRIAAPDCQSQRAQPEPGP